LPVVEHYDDEYVKLLKRPNSTFLNQEYETPFIPMGFNIKFNFYSTKGDHFYTGLNGIEFFDPLGVPILDAYKP
jgi:hypothetical protein